MRESVKPLEDQRKEVVDVNSLHLVRLRIEKLKKVLNRLGRVEWESFLARERRFERWIQRKDSLLSKQVLESHSLLNCSNLLLSSVVVEESLKSTWRKRGEV